MDGNGRWAKRRGLPRTAGHRAGVDALINVLRACRDYGVKAVSVYAFSTENYKRSDEECKFIFDLIEKFAKEKLSNLKEHNTKLVVCGDLDYSDKLSKGTKDSLMKAQEETKDCDGYILNLCFSYGGRHEITEAVNTLIKEGKTVITEEDISRCVYTHESGDPDLIVRASGETRLSKFCSCSDFFLY